MTILPGGELVVLWEVGFDVLAARRPPGGDWSAPQTISSSCCVVLRELLAGADGTAVGLWTSTDDDAQTAVKPPGAASFEPAQDLPLSSFLDRPTDIAIAPDGSVVVVGPDPCGELTCIAGVRRSGGAWGAVEPIAVLEHRPVRRRRDGERRTPSFTAVWTESNDTVEGFGPPGWCAAPIARPAPAAGTPQPAVVADLPGATPAASNAEDCVDLAVGPQGQHVAVWGQRGPADDRVAASAAPGGGAWGPTELVALTDGRDASPRTAITSTGIPVVAGAGGGPVGNLARAAHRTGAGAWTVDELGAALSGASDLGDGRRRRRRRSGDGLASTRRARRRPASTAPGRASARSRCRPPAASGQALRSRRRPTTTGPALASISWLFGDGGSAFGGAVSHAYGAAGTLHGDRDGHRHGRQRDASSRAPSSRGAHAGGLRRLRPRGRRPRWHRATSATTTTAPSARVPFKTVNATVVSGEVFVKLPAGSASASQAKPPKGFVRLEGAETIPVGATLDTLRGRVKIRSAANTRRKTQTGQFFRGRFVIRQARIKRRSRTLITDMRLTGTSFRRRCGTTASVSQRRRRSKKRVRRLFGDAKGTFRTSGRNAAATVRGTRWGVQDRCDGTLVAVQRGRVEVRDKVKRKTIILRRGKTYLARAR